MALTNRFVLVEYDVPGPRVVHERMVLEHICDEDYIVATPDADVYCETLSILNRDLSAIRVRPGPNTLPAGVPAAAVYGLPAWGAAQLAGIRAAGVAEASAERARRGLGVAGPGVAVVPVDEPARAAVAGGADEFGPGARDIVGIVWVAAESIGAISYGDVIPGVGAPAVLGSKTIHNIAEGKSIFCECINADKVEEFNGRPARCDSRILSRKKNALGSPERPLTELVAEMKEVPMGWSLIGPRTAKWCLNYLVVESLGFEAHHERFRQLCKLEPAAWGVQEHFQLSMVLRQLIQVDMMDGLNSLGVELMFRRLQTIEYAHSEKAREMESRSVGGKLSLEEQYTFGSLVRQAGTLMIAPTLLEHVKAEVQKDVELQKNMRKAREERDIARKAKGKKGDSENP